MTYTIAEITESDIPRSAEVLRASFATVATAFRLTRENCPTYPAFMDETVLLREYSRGVLMFGLYVRQKQVGFVALEECIPSFWLLEKLAILPAHRHHGYGARLLEHACAHARRHGGKRISIDMIHENKALVDWYEWRGFIRTGLRVFEGHPYTSCLMQLDM